MVCLSGSIEKGLDESGFDHFQVVLVDGRMSRRTAKRNNGHVPVADTKPALLAPNEDSQGDL